MDLDQLRLVGDAQLPTYPAYRKNCPAFWNTIGNHIGGCHVHYPIMLLTTPRAPPIIGALGVGLFPQACVGGTVVWFGLEQWLMLVRSIVVVGHYPGHPHSSPGQNPWLPTHGL